MTGKHEHWGPLPWLVGREQQRKEAICGNMENKICNTIILLLLKRLKANFLVNV
jgi:hypothetical protein